MANSLYDHGRRKFLEGNIAWLTDDIRMILVDTTLYTKNLATHEFLTSIVAGARVAVSSALTGKTSTAGVADCADVTFTSVTGNPCAAVVIYKHTGVDSTSPLLGYIDTGTGLPIIPNGGNIVVQISEGSAKLFKL